MEKAPQTIQTQTALNDVHIKQSDFYGVYCSTHKGMSCISTHRILPKWLFFSQVSLALFLQRIQLRLEQAILLNSANQLLISISILIQFFLAKNGN